MNVEEFKFIVTSLKDRHDIAAVIGRHLKLNSNLKTLCPFHEESEPSFSVNEQEQYFHCFGCGVGGDVIRFIQLYKNFSFMEALTTLAIEVGMSIPTMSSEITAKIVKDASKHHILSVSAAYYHRQLTEEARNYLHGRGFTNETIDQFQIGWANGKLKNYLVDELNLKIDDCIKSGVLKLDDRRGAHDFYIKRVIFPNRVSGQVVHLTGRVIDEGKPKYLHVSGVIDHFFNENAIRNKTILMTEGVTDAIAAEQAGHSAIALYGVNGHKPEQIVKLSKCDRIYVCFDGDKTGRESAQKLARVIGHRCRIVQLPEGEDLCEYMTRNQPEKLRELLEQAKDLISYHIEAIPSDIDKVKLSDALTTTIQLLANVDPAKAEAYLSNDIKNQFGLNREEVEAYRRSINHLRAEIKSNHLTSKSSKGVKPHYTAQFEGLVDIVEQDGCPVFLIKEGNEVLIHPEYECDGKIYVPPRPEKIPWLLPNAERVLEIVELGKCLSDRECYRALYDDLISYHQPISELPDTSYYDLVVAWDMHTYILENFQHTPIICLFAVPERGKSRTGRAMINVAYRGVSVESLREAYIFRLATDWGASIFFDVMNIWKKAEDANSIDILLCRFERGATVARVLHPDRGAHEDITFYRVFGPTVIGTNTGVHRILETRAIQIIMPEASRSFDKHVTEELALPLKERLLAFRARQMGRTLPEVSKVAASRLGDILKPLHQVIMLVRPEREQVFKKLACQLYGERRIEKSESLEAQILRAVIGLEGQVQNAKLPVKLITDEMNRDRTDGHKFSPQTIGRRLASIGFGKGKTNTGASSILWDDGMIGRLKLSYGLEETSVTSVTSVSSAKITDISDVTDVTDVSEADTPTPPHNDTGNC